MKSLRSSSGWAVRVLIAVCLGFLFAGSPPQSLAEPADNSADALAVAQVWVAQIDAGQFDDSYALGCVAFHQKVTLDKWTSVLKTLRIPFGAVVSRKVLSHLEKPDGFEGLEGECMIFRYQTSFKKLPEAFEVVVVKKEDGKWKGAGYNVVPKPATEAAPVPTVQ